MCEDDIFCLNKVRLCEGRCEPCYVRIGLNVRGRVSKAKVGAGVGRRGEKAVRNARVVDVKHAVGERDDIRHDVVIASTNGAVINKDKVCLISDKGQGKGPALVNGHAILGDADPVRISGAIWADEDAKAKCVVAPLCGEHVDFREAKLFKRGGRKSGALFNVEQLTGRLACKVTEPVGLEPAQVHVVHTICRLPCTRACGWRGKEEVGGGEEGKEKERGKKKRWFVGGVAKPSVCVCVYRCVSVCLCVCVCLCLCVSKQTHTATHSHTQPHCFSLFMHQSLLRYLLRRRRGEAAASQPKSRSSQSSLQASRSALSRSSRSTQRHKEMLRNFFLFGRFQKNAVATNALTNFASLLCSLLFCLTLAPPPQLFFSYLVWFELCWNHGRTRG